METISREHAEVLAMKWLEGRYNPPRGYQPDWNVEVAKFMEEYDVLMRALKPYILEK